MCMTDEQNMGRSVDIIAGIRQLSEQDGANWREVFARLMAAFTEFADRQPEPDRSYIIESAVAGILGWRRAIAGYNGQDVAVANELARVASMLSGSDDVRIAHLLSVLAVFIASTADPDMHVRYVITGIQKVVKAVQVAARDMAS